MNTAIEYLGVAGLLALRALSTNKGLPRTRADFVQEFETRYNWALDATQAEKALQQLEAWSFVTILTDRYAGESLKFSKVSTEETMFRFIPDDVADLLTMAREGGLPWFNDVFKNQNFWVDLHNDFVRVESNGEELAVRSEANASVGSAIPASDRIVTINDNRPTIELLAADIRGLSEELRENNELAFELGDEKELIEGELRAAEILVERPSFRLQRLYYLIVPALRFLAEKFASGAIGEMAKRLLNLLLGLA